MKEIVESEESRNRLLLDKRALAARYVVGIRTIENWLAFGIIFGHLDSGRVMFDPVDCDNRIISHSQKHQQQRKEDKR